MLARKLCSFENYARSRTVFASRTMLVRELCSLENRVRFDTSKNKR
ncbi:MAG: hypothetical protein IJT45_05795 [Bacteroidales bacterium]|nr:hypothetical protein [Bacteroidales bacterium]